MNLLTQSKIPGSMHKLTRAISMVYIYAKEHLDKGDKIADEFSIDDVYVVWFSSTLQNWKALVSTNLTDGMYYEVTHNGDKNVTYLDAYKKWDNIEIPD
jgi:hypothetical protein